ncbi:hypothetical protein WDU94_007429 [Cyamophila willieti]
MDSKAPKRPATPIESKVDVFYTPGVNPNPDTARKRLIFKEGADPKLMKIRQSTPRTNDKNTQVNSSNPKPGSRQDPSQDRTPLYSIPTSNQYSPLENSSTEFDRIIRTDVPTIVGGDFKAHHIAWKCLRSDAKGKKLIQHSDSRNYIINVPDKPTHIPSNPNRKPSTIDLFLSCNVPNISQPITHLDLSSDHNPVTIEVNKLELTKEERLHYAYKLAKWEDFSANLQAYKPTYDNIPLSKAQIEKEIQTLTSAIQTQIKECIPIKALKVSTEEGIAEALAENYENIHKTTCNMDIPRINLLVKASLSLYAGQTFSDDQLEEMYTTRNEIESIVKTLKNTKAPGEDKIQGCIVKKLPPNIIDILVDIFNSSIKHQHFPSSWKNANIIAIHKPGKNSHLATSYRPISLLPILGKIFERIILERLLNSNIKLIQDEQFRFRKRHSTCHQLARILDYLTKHYASSIPVTMVLLDIEKAFDCVWHDGIIYKMYQLKINQIIIRLVKSYLENRTFQVA